MNLLQNACSELAEAAVNISLPRSVLDMRTCCILVLNHRPLGLWFLRAGN